MRFFTVCEKPTLSHFEKGVVSKQVFVKRKPSLIPGVDFSNRNADIMRNKKRRRVTVTRSAVGPPAKAAPLMTSLTDSASFFYDQRIITCTEFDTRGRFLEAKCFVSKRTGVVNG